MASWTGFLDRWLHLVQGLLSVMRDWLGRQRYLAVNGFGQVRKYHGDNDRHCQTGNLDERQQ